MRISNPGSGWLMAGLLIAASAATADDGIEVRLDPEISGIDRVYRRCFAALREAGEDPDRMPASEMAACMRPELEAMAEFAYEVSTAYAVSSLTRIALETCTLEQANALDAAPRPGAGAEVLSWRWLTDCVKEVRWLEHDEQTQRLRRARRAAKKRAGK